MTAAMIQIHTEKMWRRSVALCGCEKQLPNCSKIFQSFLMEALMAQHHLLQFNLGISSHDSDDFKAGLLMWASWVYLLRIWLAVIYAHWKFENNISRSYRSQVAFLTGFLKKYDDDDDAIMYRGSSVQVLQGVMAWWFGYGASEWVPLSATGIKL